ncbi:MAG TPA: hypothetical protein VHA35_00150 [Dongiaceae bacterium]|nr:hypothetical protein [Dongiaceae bacterium]
MEAGVTPMARWFRLYDAVLDDPKVQRLPDRMFKAWINLLCLASRHGGALPPAEDVAFALRTTEEQAILIVGALSANGLLDRHDEGLRIHGWETRQYQSDGSAARMRRHRAKQRGVTVTSPESESEPEQSQNRAESDAGASAHAQDGPHALQNEGEGDGRTGGGTAIVDVAAWEPSAGDRAYAAGLGLDPERVLEDLRGWAANAAPGRRRKRDPSRFWQGWCRRDADAGRNRAGCAGSRANGARNPGLLAAALEVIAQGEVER